MVASCALPSPRSNKARGEVFVLTVASGFLVVFVIVPIEILLVICMLMSSSSLSAKSCFKILARSVSPWRTEVLA